MSSALRLTAQLVEAIKQLTMGEYENIEMVLPPRVFNLLLRRLADEVIVMQQKPDREGLLHATSFMLRGIKFTKRGHE